MPTSASFRSRPVKPRPVPHLPALASRFQPALEHHPLRQAVEVSRLQHPLALPRSLLATKETNKLTLNLALPIPTLPTKNSKRTNENERETPKDFEKARNKRRFLYIRKSYRFGPHQYHASFVNPTLIRSSSVLL